MNNDTLKFTIGIIALFLLIIGSIIILFYIPNISFAAKGIMTLIFGVIILLGMLYCYERFKNKRHII